VETHRAIRQAHCLVTVETHRAIRQTHCLVAVETRRAIRQGHCVAVVETHRAIRQAHCVAVVETHRAIRQAHCVAVVETCRDKHSHCAATQATATMIVHVVLFRLKPGLSEDARDALAASLARATREIPSIRGARIGSRVTIGRAYEQLMTTDYSFAAILEFDDRSALQTYLDHPAHEQLARRFYASVGDALTYDFELWDSDEGLERIRGVV